MVVSFTEYGCKKRWNPDKELRPGQKNISFHQNDGSSSDTDNASETDRMIENSEGYKTRWRSIRVLYLTVFINTVSIGVVISSMWPYLKKVDKKLSPTIVGWIFCAFSLAQVIGSILFGIWCHYTPAVQPLIASLLLRGVGSLLYGYAVAFADSGVNVILISRIIIGLSAGNVAVCRAVVSQMSTMTERVKVFANFSAFQSLGFAVGPAMQIALYPFGEGGFYFAPLDLRLNIYTAPGFLGLIMAIVNMVAVCVWFKETEVDIYDGQKDYKVDIDKNSHPDYIAICLTIATFFTFMAVTVQVETLITPLSMDEFAWTKPQATLYVGIILLCGFGFGIFCCQAVGFASQRYGERVMLTTGLIVLVTASIIYLPWGNEYPLLQTSKKIITGNVTKLIITPGCSPKYRWCTTTPRIYLPQFLIGTFVLFIGYSFCYPVTKSIYSKLVGPGKQGKFMGLLSATGAAARALGPLLLLNAYVEIGPRWMFLVVIVLLLLIILLLICNYQRIVPFHEYLERIKTT